MSERLDLLIKYLRLVAAVWLGFVPFLYLISFMSGVENISINVFLTASLVGNSFAFWLRTKCS